MYAFVNMNCRIISRAMTSAFGFIVGKNNRFIRRLRLRLVVSQDTVLVS